MVTRVLHHADALAQRGLRGAEAAGDHRQLGPGHGYAGAEPAVGEADRLHPGPLQVLVGVGEFESDSRWTTPVSAWATRTGVMDSASASSAFAAHSSNRASRCSKPPAAASSRMASGSIAGDPQPGARCHHPVDAVLDPTEAADGVGVVAVGRDQQARLAHLLRQLGRAPEDVLSVAIAPGVDERLTEH